MTLYTNEELRGDVITVVQCDRCGAFELPAQGHVVVEVTILSTNARGEFGCTAGVFGERPF